MNPGTTRSTEAWSQTSSFVITIPATNARLVLEKLLWLTRPQLAHVRFTSASSWSCRAFTHGA